ncbi:MAG: hypothetical protein JL56_07280 [Desulfotomaculum sp. BICA1-6]|nr:MAG: hypothetical protein JL56_07280 [Desulfotomaculum sp. BICA1-6]
MGGIVAVILFLLGVAFISKPANGRAGWRGIHRVMQRRPRSGARIAERVRDAVQNTPARTTAGEIRITASFGVAECIGGDTPDTVKEKTDQALYRAKQSGRNRVEISRKES